MVINKADNPRLEQEGAEFFALGMDPAITVSAQHGRNTGDLADMIVDALPPAPPTPPEPDWTDESLSPDELTELAETEMGPPRVAIVGRPNTEVDVRESCARPGTMIVSDAPGTTRDPVDTAVVVDDSPLVLVDTAGIRRRGSVQQGIERYSVLRSMKAIDRADVAVVMTDATEGYTAQDARGRARGGRQGHRAGHQQVDVVEKDGHTADAWLKVCAARHRTWPGPTSCSPRPRPASGWSASCARAAGGRSPAHGRPEPGRRPMPTPIRRHTSATAWARSVRRRSRSRRPRS